MPGLRVKPRLVRFALRQLGGIAADATASKYHIFISHSQLLKEADIDIALFLFYFWYDDLPHYIIFIENDIIIEGISLSKFLILGWHYCI